MSEVPLFRAGAVEGYTLQLRGPTKFTMRVEGGSPFGGSGAPRLLTFRHDIDPPVLELHDYAM